MPYTYPQMLREHIATCRTWDQSHAANRRALRTARLHYWLWWRWAPLPAVLVGVAAGVVPVTVLVLMTR